MSTIMKNLPLEERARVEEMARDMLHSIVNGNELKYDSSQAPMVALASLFIDESGFIEVTGGTAKSVMAGFPYGRLTEKGADYLKHTNQG